MSQPQFVIVRLLVGLFALPLLTLPACAQTGVVSAAAQAQVTFYSSGQRFFNYYNHRIGAFKGRIYEDDRQLVFMEPGHFVTFHFDAGPHTFSANSWMSKHANADEHVIIELVAGQHYFIRSFFFATFFGPVRFVVLEDNCDGAQVDNIRAKPLELPHLRPAGSKILVPETSFPQCS